MIIVMPDANTGIGHILIYLQNWLYEDFFFNELMPYVESKYRIKSEKIQSYLWIINGRWRNSNICIT